MSVYGIPQSTCPFAVYYADVGQVCQVGVVQVFVQDGEGFVHCLAQQVNLRGDGERLGHLELAGAGTGIAALKGRSGDGLFLGVDQVLYVGVGADDAALYEQGAFGVGQRADRALQAHGNNLYGIALFQFFGVYGFLFRGF